MRLKIYPWGAKTIARIIVKENYSCSSFRQWPTIDNISTTAYCLVDLKRYYLVYTYIYIFSGLSPRDKIMSKHIIISKAWENVAKDSRFRGRWMCDETWFRLIKANYPHIDELDDNGFSRETLNRAINSVYKLSINNFTDSNMTGIFGRQFRQACPYDTTKRRRVYYYYLTEPG